MGNACEKGMGVVKWVSKSNHLPAPRAHKQILIRKSIPHPRFINTAIGGKKKAITKRAISRPE